MEAYLLAVDLDPLDPLDLLEEGEIPQTGGGGNNGKLIGREPDIFDGTCEKVEMFLQEWNIYHGLNWQSDIMNIPFSRAMMFLSYIKGAKVQEWVGIQLTWLTDQMGGGAQVTDRYLWATILQRFRDAFEDTMSMQRAENDIKTLKME